MNSIHKLLPILLIILSCNDHEITPLDQALSSSSEQRITVSAKTKIDILFVIDESESMKEEQISLADNFNTFTDFIFDDLDNAADYRIAVTSMGAKAPDNNIYPVDLGVFVSTTKNPNVTGCPPNLPQVISPQTLIAAGCAESDAACQQAKLGEHFTCLAKVGTEGVIFEKGLEAMRSALSCNGPNGSFFGDCCRPDPTGQRLIYDPLCRPTTLQPEFLRPDALLMVVFITDEDDCSSYSDSVDSPFTTCRANPRTVNEFLDGGDREGAVAAISASYNDPLLCPGGDAQGCYTRECTTASGAVLDPVDCYFSRCSVRVENLNDCRWQYNKLAPVSYYYDFLISLKARPLDQILVANIVSPGVLTNAGQRLSFSQDPNMIAGCASNDGRSVGYEECCPNGFCGAISDYNACANYPDALGYSSWRYIDLVSQFGDNGLGWTESRPEDVQICDPDLRRALSALKEKVLLAVGDYCVARRPACTVVDPVTGQPRECDEVEATVPANYQIRLNRTCDPATILSNECVPGYITDYDLDINDPTCPSGVRVGLRSPPPAGSTTQIEMLQSNVSIDE
jgi:hypothetical protein